MGNAGPKYDVLRYMMKFISPPLTANIQSK